MKISALVLTRNEEELIGPCLAQLSFADEIIVCDQNSTDKTCEIAQKYTKNIIRSNSDDFSQNRNLLAKQAKGDWLLYVDTDERLDHKLTSEIKEITASGSFAAFYIARKNIILGKWLRHGGWWPDYAPRLFKKKSLIGWEGKVHETPKVDGEFGYLKIPLEHLTARSLSQMFAKTIRWAHIEAELNLQAKSSPVSIMKITKSILTEFFNRYFTKMGFWDGQIGLVQAIYQALHQAIVLTYIWEMQNTTEKKHATS